MHAVNKVCILDPAFARGDSLNLVNSLKLLVGLSKSLRNLSTLNPAWIILSGEFAGLIKMRLITYKYPKIRDRATGGDPAYGTRRV